MEKSVAPTDFDFPILGVRLRTAFRVGTLGEKLRKSNKSLKIQNKKRLIFLLRLYYNIVVVFLKDKGEREVYFLNCSENLSIEAKPTEYATSVTDKEVDERYSFAFSIRILVR